MSEVVSAEDAVEARTWDVPEVAGQAPISPHYRTASQLEQIELAAREEGYANGLAEGRAEAARQLGEQLGALEQLLATLHTPLERLDDDVFAALVQLTHSMAATVVGREVAADPQCTVDALRQAIGRLPGGDEPVRLRLHPQDAALLREVGALDEIERPWRLVDDPSLSRGGCIVETASSSVDATLEARLGAVLAATLGDAGINGTGDGAS